MSKTAEGIIREYVGIKEGAGPLTPMDYAECVACMQKFAAQEVEAYKERLKAEIDRSPKITLYYSAEAINLIDTVK